MCLKNSRQYSILLCAILIIITQVCVRCTRSQNTVRICVPSSGMHNSTFLDAITFVSYDSGLQIIALTVILESNTLEMYFWKDIGS